MDESAGVRRERIRRFSPCRIAEHWFIIVTTVILFATGLSQRFWTLDASQWVILKLGGIDNVRLIHRYTGILFALQILLHVAVAVAGIARGRWQPTMLIGRQDLADAVHNIRYYFGLEEHAARCDRYDYMEKFEYWTILIGGFLMIGTGVVLWLPTLFAAVLPGEFVPVAKVLHSNEALLIFLLNAVWHIYNAVFSPEVFPLDTSIFTGTISRERMAREHPLELARIEGADPEAPAGDGGKEIRALVPGEDGGTAAG